MKKRFPTFATLLLVLALIWLFSDLNIIKINIPWIPIILIVVALGMIVNRVSS